MSEIRVNKIDDSGQGFVEAVTRIKTNLAPVESTDLANKAYVDSRTSGGGGGVGSDYVDSRDAYYYSQVNQNFVHKTGNLTEEIDGLKIFETAPQTQDSPNNARDITNKYYVDLQDSSILNQSRLYTDSAFGSVNAAGGFSNVEMPNWTYTGTWQSPSGASGTRQIYQRFNTQRFDGTGTTKFQIAGINGISVTGATGYEPIISGTGNSVSTPYQRIIIDGSGVGDTNYQPIRLITGPNNTYQTVPISTLEIGKTYVYKLYISGSGSNVVGLAFTSSPYSYDDAETGYSKGESIMVWGYNETNGFGNVANRSVFGPVFAGMGVYMNTPGGPSNAAWRIQTGAANNNGVAVSWVFVKRMI